MLIVLQKMLYQIHNLLVWTAMYRCFMKIQPFVSSLWQERWDKKDGNQLHVFMPQIDDKYYSGCTNRNDEVIINRPRIGHKQLTLSFRIQNKPHPPLCDQCEGDHESTVKHTLIECCFLKIIRRRHCDVTDLNQLFKTVSSKKIIDFAIWSPLSPCTVINPILLTYSIPEKRLQIETVPLWCMAIGGYGR